MPPKLLSLLFLLLNCYATAQTPSRLQQRVSITVTHGTLEDLLTVIQQRYSISFSYVRQLIPLQNKITVRASNQPLEKVLQQALQGTGITFHEAGTQIVLSPPLTAPKNDSTYTQTIQGTVMDKALLLPIAGATVMIASLPGKGTITDKNGRFQVMHIPVGRHEILVRSIGYKTAQIPNVLVISGKQTLLPVMLEDAEGPVNKKQESSYLLGYRFLNYEMLQHIGVDLNIDGAPKFQDLTFKLHFRDKGYGAFTLFGLGGKSRISFQEKVTDTRNLSRKVANTYSQFTSDMGGTGDPL